MRMPRLVAVALWLLVAGLAVAGFANFSPQATPIQTTTTTVSPTVRGSTTGQVMARALAAGFRAGEGSETSFPEAIELDPQFSGPQLIPPPPETTTTTSPTTTTAPRRRVTTAGTTNASLTPLSEDEARSILALYFKPEDIDLALRIAKCESTLIPGNVNKSSGASGLFQHLPKYWSKRAVAAGLNSDADILDPYNNAKVAAWLVYEGGGWTHWTCYHG